MHNIASTTMLRAMIITVVIIVTTVIAITKVTEKLGVMRMTILVTTTGMKTATETGIPTMIITVTNMLTIAGNVMMKGVTGIWTMNVGTGITTMMNTVTGINTSAIKFVFVEC